MAYLLKAKQNIEEQDINEFKIKKEKVQLYCIIFSKIILIIIVYIFITSTKYEALAL